MKYFSWTILLLLLVGSGTTWAQQTSIKQRLLMPGEVIEGHAKFEAQCEECHSSFDQAAMPSLCLDCHDEIRADRNSKKGFHGQSPLASVQPCQNCHTDHLGRDADIIAMQVDSFSHSWTRFPLEGNHAPLACESCHEAGKKFRDAEPACVSCHKEDDFHKEALGTDCANCHQPHGWQKRLEFDHSTTDFPLKGLHEEVACSGCHVGQRYQFEETTCVSCHKAADVHAGKNGQKCDTCHSVNGWDTLVFNHNTTDFPLAHRHRELPCRACHSNGVVEQNTPMACHGCHADDDIHLGRNGKQCDSCHTPMEWKKAQFNHAKEVGFPLLGQHQNLSCTSCHVGALQDELPRDCAGCHAADDPHKNPDMQMCATCHVTDGWNTISRFDHNFTQFPLVGLHSVVPCQNCHLGNQFAGTESTCASCHKSDDHHGGALGDQCQTCHSPNAWNLWQFDHEEHTGYALLGAHKDVACDTCHAPGTDPGKTPAVCGNCHSRQDIHNGGFGQNCGRCHSQNKFFELILLQD